MDLEKRLYEALRAGLTNPRAPRPDLFREPPVGSVVETEYGPIWKVETIYEQGYLHGKSELSVDVPRLAVEYLDSAVNPSEFDFRKIAVIDTETTGLAGGTGTYPFIIGIGFFEKDRFVVRQYILRDFCEEPAQLDAFSRDILRTTSLLTYNGKSFDIPLLRTRFRINRLSVPFDRFPHLDLVHPCRRIYRRHFDSFRLSDLEAAIIGFERSDDIPSHLIPGIYFDYLQNRDEQLLLPILNHNRDDIVSLYLLAQVTAERIALACEGACEDDLFLLSLAHIAFGRKDHAHSRFFIDRIKAQFAPAEAAMEASMLKAILAKKNREWDEAMAIWRKMLHAGWFGCYPHIEMAKHMEHRMRDFKSALDLTESALKLIEFEREMAAGRDIPGLDSALRRRRRRLIRKISNTKSADR